MKKIILLIAFLLSSIYGFSQASGYVFSETTDAYAAVVGTASTATADDGLQNGIPIGFTFKFDGTDYTHFCVSTNGWMKFGSASTTGATGEPNWSNNLVANAGNRPLIAAFWDDNNNSTGNIQYLVSGVAPNRTLEVGWDGVDIGGNGGTSTTAAASFKIRITETSNVIDIIYGPTMTAAGTLTASVGINGMSSFLSVLPGAPSVTSSVTGYNTISATTNLVGKKFTFTPPSCIAPTGVVASAITTSSATVSWSAAVPAPATGYEYVVSTDVNPPTAAGTPTTALSITANTLMPATTYYIFVRSNCGTGFSAWSFASFVTPCVPFVTLAENFDATNVNSLPICWSKILRGASGGGAIIGVTNANSNSGANSAQIFNSFNPTTTNDFILVSPELTNLNAGTHRLRFFVRGIGDLQVGTLNNNTATGFFTLVQTITSTSTYQEFIVNFPASAGTNAYIGFRHSAAATFVTFNIDDVSWNTIPNVAPVCATSIIAIPDALCGNFNTAVSWTGALNADGYRISVGTTPGGTNILNNVNIGNVISYGIPTSPATTYYYKITPYNVVGDAVGCNEQSYTSVANGCYCPSVPTSNDGAGISNVQIDATDFLTTDVTYFDHTSNTVTLQQSVNSNVQVTFATGQTYNTNIWIDFNNNSAFEASELVKTGVSLVTNPTIFNASFIMPNAAALGIHRMRIVSTDDIQVPANPCYSGTWGVTLDFNVDITAAPSCIPPEGLAFSALASTSATISWTALPTAPATGYEYLVATSNEIPTIAGIPTTAALVNLESLTPNTEYFVFVRSNCTSSFSAWSQPISFTTTCTPVTAFSENFDAVTAPNFPTCWGKVGTAGTANISATTPSSVPNTLYMLTESSTIRAVVKMTPVSNLGAGTHRLSFRMRANGTTGIPLQLGYLTNPADPASFVVIGATNVTSLIYENYSISPPAGVYNSNIALRNAGTSFGSVLIDNVKWEPIPSCLEPASGVISAITAASATISWTAPVPAPAVGYQYVVSTVATAPTAAGTNVTGITENVLGLMSNTTYSLFVRSNCGSEFSAWAGPFNFVTACAPEATPATVNFAVFPPSRCWSNLAGGDLATGPTGALGSGAWETDGFANITSTGAAKINVWRNILNSWLITPSYIIPAAGYKLNFDAAATQYLSSFGGGVVTAPTTPWEADDKIEVLVSTTGTTNWTVISTFNSTNQPTFTGTSYSLNLDAYAGQTIKVAFRALEGANNGDADIDFSIDNLAVTNVLKTATFDVTGFAAYPNPVRDILNLSYTKDISNVAIYNLLGQEVLTKSINASQSKIDMSNLSNGTYLVKVTVDGLVKTLKVVKE